MSDQSSSPTRRGFLRTSAMGAVTIAATQLAAVGSADAQSGKSEAGRSSQDQARDEYIVRFPEADRGRCAQCRLRRGGPGRWCRGLASSRLAV